MHRPVRLVLALCLTVLGACSHQEAAAPPSAAAVTASGNDPRPAARIEAHVRFLADDLLEGRAAGTRGFDLASLYVATEFRLMGLLPAGDDGTYFQSVPPLKGERVEDGAKLEVERDGVRTALKFQTDFLPAINFAQSQVTVTAPMVFVGQAVSAPELDHDDFAGIDLKGKVAVLFSNAPPGFGNDQRAYYANSREKSRQLVAHGAVGTIYLGNPVDEAKRSWETTAANWRQPGMRLVDSDGMPIDDFPELRGRAYLRASGAELLFAGSGHSAADVFEQLQKGQLKPFDLTGTVTLAQAATLTPMKSRNVVARLPGSDARLANEAVVMSAHLDHLGIGAPVNGDSIYNGALDNALGVGVMLEAAQGLFAASERPRRSVLFLAVTGEEKGLLGAEQFARHPTVPRESIMADINMDMPMLLDDLTDVVPIGIEHSSLKAVVEQATQQMGIALSPDPFPEEVVFVRSDQFAFIRQGIPAVYLDGGVTARDSSHDMRKIQQDFLGQHYHLPSDDLSLPIHYPSAARLAELNLRIATTIANTDQRPSWNAGDFLAGKFANGLPK